VIVGAGNQANAVPVRVVREALQIADDPLRFWNVELAVGVHEVVLGIDVPEDDTGHGGRP